MRRKVLFLCTHNSARSQMAEGWLRHLGGDRFEVCSAGSIATEVRPEAVAVMKEVGVDLSGYASKTLDRYLYEAFDLVVTVCDQARDTCPTFPNAVERLHWSIADPSTTRGTERDVLEAFRDARDELGECVRSQILSPPVGAVDGEHLRKLERMYLSAPTNEYYRPEIDIGAGEARIEISIRPEFFHAAGGVHGSVYFKLLDDACFFAAASQVDDVFVLTRQFNIHLLQPVSSGRLHSTGRVQHASGSSLLVAGELYDDHGNLLARGEGTFVRSKMPLEPAMGYR